MDSDQSAALRAQVTAAVESRTKLNIAGAGTKSFYGRPVVGLTLDVTEHRGITNYMPTELVITARCGTPLMDIEKQLAEHRQMLPFEPPHFGPATLGGCIASGLSGPRRPYSGAARDFVLGARVINGEGHILKFGAEVFKNVAGFDAARLMAGALGTLGVLLEVSVKVLPKPAEETTLVLELDPARAVTTANNFASRPLPISAAAYDGNLLYIRLSGNSAAVVAARERIGGNELPGQNEWWRSVREQTHPFFTGPDPLWCLTLPAATPPLPIVGQWFYEWHGAQRWLKTALPLKIIRETAARAGGHANLFRNGQRDGNVFHPLPEPLKEVHKRLKRAFDPYNIFNPGRLYPDI